MCFHYSLIKERAEIALQLDVDWDDNTVWQPTYHANGFTFPTMPIITQESPKKIQVFNWGLIPSWIKNEQDAKEIKTQTLNARSETVYEKPSFKNSIINQRCLVIADGFYEWLEYQKTKYPHYIYLKNKPIFCFAGLYSNWKNNNGETVSSFSILTTTANPMMERIHITKKRMPVILKKEDYAKWLDPNISLGDTKNLLQPFTDKDMDFHTINKLISSKTENTNCEKVIANAIYPELAFL
jgi:putative SOS response-associated peptidase YedK